MNDEKSGEVEIRRENALSDSSNTGSKTLKCRTVIFSVESFILSLVTHDLLFISTQLLTTIARKMSNLQIARDFNWRRTKCWEKFEKPRRKL